MSGVRKACLAGMLPLALGSMACIPHVVNLPAAERAEAHGAYHSEFFNVTPPRGRWRAYPVSSAAHGPLSLSADTGLLAGAHRFHGLRDLLHDVAIAWLGGVKFCRVRAVVTEVLETGARESEESGCLSVVAYARMAGIGESGTDSAVVAAMRARVASVMGSEAHQTLFGVKSRHGRGRLRERQIAGRLFYEALIVSEEDSTRIIERERGKLLVYLDSLRIFAVHLPNAALEAGSPEWLVVESFTPLK
jgi:hypothetical protein